MYHTRQIGGLSEIETKKVEFMKEFSRDVIELLVVFANADGGDIYIGIRVEVGVVGVDYGEKSETNWIVEVELKDMESWFGDILRNTDSEKTLRRLLFAICANPHVGTQDTAASLGEERSVLVACTNLRTKKASGIPRRIGPDNGRHLEVPWK